MSRPYAIALVCAWATTCAACAVLANLGDERVLEADVSDAGPEDTILAEAEAAPDADALAPDAPDAPDAPVIDPGGTSMATTGRLQQTAGAFCTAFLVGPSTLLTAASCFPRHAHGCETASDALAGWSFALGKEIRQPDGLSVAPLAYGSLAACSPSCDPAQAADVRAMVRRSHDVALVHLSKPITTPAPLRVLTRLDDPTLLPGRRTLHGFFDYLRLGNLGGAAVSTTRWTEAAPIQEAMALSVADPLHGCEQLPSCNAVDVRDTCPHSRIGPPDDAKELYDDLLLRLNGFEAFAPGTALGGARGTPVVVDGSSFSTRPSLPTGDVAIGIVVDALGASGGSETLVAPTFGEEIGAFVDTRLEDFDGDCVPDDADPAPTVPLAGGCKAVSTPWSSVDLSASTPITTATAPILGLAPAVTTRGFDRLDVYARVLDHTTHHLACSGSSCLPNWESLGGRHFGGISAASPGSGRQWLVASAADATLDSRTFDGVGSWSPWSKTSVEAVVGGAAVVSIDVATTEVWYRRGQRLWRSRWSKSGGWLADEDTGVLATSDPCAVYVGGGAGRVEVLARGTDQQGFGLVRLSLAPSAPLSSMVVGLVPTLLPSAPACAAADATHLDLFVRGTRSSLLHATLGASQTSPPSVAYEELGPITSKPSATSWGDGRSDVVARGLHGEIRHWWLQR